MAEPKKLVLIDGMALAYRGHFALIRNPRMTTKNMNTSSVFVFANVLLQILTEQAPTHIAVAFDTKEPTHRKKVYPEYKATREAMPEDLAAALPYLDKLCDAMRIPTLRAPGWEADDIIGTLTARAERSGFLTLMVTPDKDYAQLVSDSSMLCRPAKGGGFDLLGAKEVLSEWEVGEIGQVVDILGLMGDASDNIPGVPGIGRKTAQKLIADFGSIEELLSRADEVSGKKGESLKEFRDQALLSKRLVTIDRDAPVDVDLEDLVCRGHDEEAVKTLFEELEFKSLAQRLLGEEAARSEGAGKGANATIAEVFHTYVLADTPEKRKTLVNELISKDSVCFDTETTGLDPKTCELVGMSFSWKEHEAWYVPVPAGREEAISILGEFRRFFQHDGIEKIGHNMKFDMLVLKWQGMEVAGPYFDTMIAAYLTAPEGRHGMDALSEELLGYTPVSIHTLIGDDGSMRDVPVEQVKDYAAEDADVTLQLAGIYRARIEESGLEKVFYEVECPLLPVLVDMEYNGIRLAAETLSELAVDLGAQITEHEAAIRRLAGTEFNVNSPKQLGEVLFDTLGLDPNAKRTSKTGQYSTSEQVLSRLAGRHEIVRRILDYRMLTKLKSTYIDMLPGAVFEKTGRIHTNYEQAVTATGRLQSHDPNLQNIPVRTDMGKEIRKAFVAADPDHLILSADYSQIELRIAAELSGDAGLRAAFASGIDIHTATAMKIFDVAEIFVNGDMRRKAKTVNFGILYGISAFGLSERLGIPRFESAELIDAYFSRFSGLKAWQEGVIESARERGYVETLTGRRRYLRDIDSRNKTIRNAAERNAINTPIQGTAADMIKLAMTKVFRRMNELNLESRMLLQVHDELVFDMLKSERDLLRETVEEGMRTALPMSVPIVVEMGEGENWLDAH